MTSPSIASAVRDQLVKLNFFGGTAGSIPGSIFSEMLIDKMPGMSRVYYASSGSEANEKGFKMVRQIAHKRYGGKKHKILYRERDYHGGTIGTMAAGGQDERNAQYGPFPDGFIRVPHCLEYRKHEQDGAPEENYGVWAANEIEKVILREGPDTVGSLCLEPVTAGGGVITPPDGYWERIREICDQYQILLHIDEVVCGVGRTGTWFGYQHYDVKPDLVTMAKGLASGYAGQRTLRLADGPDEVHWGVVGRFEILAHAGSGGMGDVFRARGGRGAGPQPVSPLAPDRKSRRIHRQEAVHPRQAGDVADRRRAGVPRCRRGSGGPSRPRPWADWRRRSRAGAARNTARC